MARSSLPGFPVATPRSLNPAVWPLAVKVALAAVCMAVLFLGLLLFPWHTLAAMLLVALSVPALALAWRYPEFGLVTLVFLGSRLLDPRFIEIRLPIGGGIELPDLALLGMAGISVVRTVTLGGAVLPRSWVMVPFLMLSWWALFSAGMAILLRGVEVSWALGELRGIAYYATLLLMMWNIRSRGQLMRLLAGLYAIGLLVVAVMLVQQFVGPVPLFASQDTASWQIVGSSSGGITRIRPPAHVLLYFISILAFVQAAYAHHPLSKVALFSLAVFMNLALLLTFTRSQWLASALALSLSLLVFPASARAAVAFLAITFVFSATLLVVSQQGQYEMFLSQRNFATPLVTRIESLFELDATFDSYSARTRYFQSDAALASIEANPATGVGLGNAYRGLTSEEANTRRTRFVRFIENSYLYLTTKMGLPALLIFAGFIVTVVLSGWRNFRLAADPLLRGVSLACLTSFIGLVIWAYNHPLFMLPEYTIMVGTIAGIGEAVGLIARGDASHESTL